MVWNNETGRARLSKTMNTQDSLFVGLNLSRDDRPTCLKILACTARKEIKCH